MKKWLITFASLSLALLLVACHSDEANSQMNQKDEKQEEENTHKEDSTKKQEDNQSEIEKKSEENDQKEDATTNEETKEEQETQATETKEEQVEEEKYTASSLQTKLSLGMTSKEVKSVLGEPNQKVIDSISGNPMYRYDLQTVNSYSYEDPFEGDSIDIEGLQSKDVQLIVFVGMKKDKVTSFNMYFYDDQGNPKNYRKNKEFEKTDDIQF